MMRRLSILISILLVGLVSGCAMFDAGELPRSTPEAEGMSAGRLARLDRVLDRYVGRGQIPGYQLLVARNGHIVHERIHGRMEIETNRALASDTIFRIYSMSKVVTGVATMIAFEQGLFLLSDPVSKYLPELGSPRVMLWHEDGTSEIVPARNEISVLDLLRHTSGISYSFAAPAPLGERYVGQSLTPGIRGLPADAGLGPAGADKEATLEDMVERLGELPLVAEPGTVWHYGINMDVLGRLIEVTSGQSFPDFLREHLFEPLDMSDTGFHVPDEKIGRFAACYGPTPEGGMRLLDDPETSEYRHPPAMPGGGGGMVSTARDYLRFAAMLEGGGELGGVRILSRKTVDLIMSNHLPPELFGRQQILGQATANDGLGIGFGLTGAVVVDPALTGLPISRDSFWWGGAASTFFWVDQEEDVIAVFMTQLVPSTAYPLKNELLRGVNAAITD